MVFTISSKGISFSLQDQLLNTFIPRAGRDRLEDLAAAKDRGIDAAIKERQEKNDRVKDLLSKAEKIDSILSFENGGTVPSDMKAKLHKGEMVVKAKDAPKVKAAMQKNGIPVPKGNGEGRPIIGYTKPAPPLKPIPVYGGKPVNKPVPMPRPTPKPKPPKNDLVTIQPYPLPKPKPSHPIYKLPDDYKIGDPRPLQPTPASRKKKKN